MRGNPSSRDQDTQVSRHQSEASADAQHARMLALAQGADLTNRAPGNCTVLRYGVDSLYLSYRGKLRDEWVQLLEQAREDAQSPSELTQAKAQVSILDHRFEVSGGGSKMFRYQLRDGAYSIQLSRSKAGKLPVAYVQLRSQWLTSVGVDQAVSQLGMILRAMASLDDEPNVSRIDLFVDFVPQEVMGDWLRDGLITRARHIATHTIVGQFSGLSIGLGGILSARLYNKLLELQKSKKDYLKTLWAAKGWTPDQEVYRLEFQFENEALKQLGLRSYRSLANCIGGLWRYASTDWLRLAIPNTEDLTKTRWPTHPMWTDLSDLPWSDFDACSRIPIEANRAPSRESIYRYYESAITSFMAVTAMTDPIEAAERLLDELSKHVDRYMDITGETFEARLRSRATRKAKQFNLGYPGEVIIDEAKVREKSRLDYLKATGRD